MSDESTVFEALTLLQNKSIDDLILEEILKQVNGSTTISIPSIKCNFFQKIRYKKNAKKIYRFCKSFLNSNEMRHCDFIVSETMKGQTTVTMRIHGMGHDEFERAKTLLVTHIKKLYTVRAR